MKVCVITTCTGEKAKTIDTLITLEEFRQGKEKVAEREKELADSLVSAEEMYTGQQHVRLMRGIDAIGRDKVDLHILSAGYGFLPADQKIAPYEATFQGMRKKELREWADQLEVPEDFREILKVPCDFTLVLLGDDYLQACAIDDELEFPSPTLLFCGKGAAKRISPRENLRIITFSNPDAKRFSCPLISLKGEIANRILSSVQKDENILQKLFDETEEDPAKCLLSKDEQVPRPGKTKHSRVRANPEVDYVISIPKKWWNEPHKKKLSYFIPEWDDLVDRDYDFLNDDHSGGAMDWSNEVYAHQMYDYPNYDGILMSRAVAEKGKRKNQRINDMGVHRYLRVPEEYPIMGDCGAFDYITEDIPPYSTEDVIGYYTRLGFDYGVSVDHLIVKATEAQKDFRYELTINNAEEFLKMHRKEKLPWEPIGAVQGWDPLSYALAAQKYVKMGYKYIGLGGMVRSTTKNILEVLRKVREFIPRDVKVHVFGIARLNAVLDLTEAGINSMDSASHLRRAWLGAGQNYFAQNGESYSAIRIPEAGKSFRAKRIVSEKRATAAFVLKTEQNCMKALLEFDKGNRDVDSVLEEIEKYDHLITPERESMIDGYRRTLEEAPWRDCPCSICRKDGIQVIIFRGNNRNRRRGFHNTYVFHDAMKKILNGDPDALSKWVPNLADKKKAKDQMLLPLA